MAPSLESLEQVVQSTQNAISQDPFAHALALRNLAKKQNGNIILASLLPVVPRPPTPVAEDAPPATEDAPAPAPDVPQPPSDPLDLIDPSQSTLVFLYIL
jgi:hypothetical protein